jgi:hypothetical protein
MPAPNTDGEYLPPAGFAASSLIDEQSLPSWLQEKQPAANQPAQKNISASSLVQPEALPEWLRTMQPQQPQSPAARPSSPDNSPTFSGQKNQAAGMSSNTPPPQGFSAHQLIDQQSLPPWLAGQTGTTAQANANGQPAAFYNQGAAPAPVQPGPQSGMGASSLLDLNSLPGWLRESEQGQAYQQQGYPQAQEMRTARPGQVANSNYNGGNLTGASLIDMNALPNWLRSADESQGQQQEHMGAARLAPSGPPPRVENMRVPSRPRGEAGQYEQSEIAANVFSSMLGVASSAPYFPAQPGSTPGYQQGFQGDSFPQQPAPAQMKQVAAQSSDPFGTTPQANYALPGMQPGLANQGYMPGAPQGYASGNQAGMPAQQLTPGLTNAPSYPASSGQAQVSNTNTSSAKPAKRGFIETIRSWFGL